ncbi:type I polyketide synthase [Thalassomonas sp. RHCl1]|uniref:type I polyketide synthase n=1 Tax=Thalassomonas sp. RHCl1 TaxID=2995320 RepID=UPI00248BB70D|nr:type I polyketide synthase [Thalassomonas sp. RHCl1]
MEPSTPDHRILMVNALQEIKALKSRITGYQAAENEPIAIIGMACRFPGGANDPHRYWQLLRDGRDAIAEVPGARWDLEQFYALDREAFGKMYSRCGGFVEDIFGFDAGFFGISPREAQTMDPHQRILLEVCWETLEYANILPSSLAGSNTGVFIGVSSMDQIVNQFGEARLTDVGPYHGSGCALAPIAGRVSYNFGFNGPSMVVDTACSSSLLSLHLAAESLRRQECDMALAGGSHFLLHPGYSIAFCKANMLSEDGRCKTFDAKANGYVRGEGCGVVALKRLSDAQRDGDTVLALLRGSAVNQDGASGGLTVPNGPAQEQVIKKALARAGLDVASVDYIEAHGTGTPLGDPIEIGALGNVFKQPLLVGSVKTNVGHLEASAGIAAAIKVALSLQHKSIPPHLHFNKPNPLIPWSETDIKVPTQLTPWHKQEDRQRVAGISSFGFSGTNVHLLMSDLPKAEAEPQGQAARAEQLLTLSARHIDALKALAKRWAQGPLAEEDADFAALCAGAAHYRSAFKVRLALVADSAARARTLLLEFADKGQAEGISLVEVPDEVPGIAFLFTGQGAQYPGMGQALYQEEDVFREAIDECAALLGDYCDIDLLDLLYPKSPRTDTGLLNETGNTQPALFSFEYALARLWQSRGIQPAALMGHSVGEYVAACVAGVFSLADALKLIAGRGRLMQALPAGGAMAAILAAPERVESLLENGADSLSVAAYNAPRNTVVSGDGQALDALLALLQEQGIEYRRLAVSHAFHSPLMQPMLSDFRRLAAQIHYHKPKLPLISNVSGRFAGEEIASADYWGRHVLAPVRFTDGLEQLSARGYHFMLELGPATTLVGMARQSVGEHAVLAASLNKDQSPGASMLAALGQYWLHGGQVDWSQAGMQARRDIQLPLYPFQHRDFRQAIDIDAAHGGLQGMTSLEHPLLQRCFKSPLLQQTLFETTFSRKNQPFLDEHRVFGKLVVAGASHLSLVLSALSLAGLSSKGGSLSQVMFPTALIVPEQGECAVQLSLTPQSGNSGEFRLMSLPEQAEPKLHAKGQFAANASPAVTPDLQAARERCREKLAAEEVYRLQEKRHIVVGPSYHWLTELQRGPSEAIARLRLPSVLENVIQNYSIHPGLIDSCFGAMVIAKPMEISESFIPFSIEALHVYPPSQGFAGVTAFIAHAVVRECDHMKMLGDIHLYSEQGEMLAAFVGLEGRSASRQALLAADENRAPELYHVDWQQLQPVMAPDSPSIAQPWLIFADAGGIGEQLAATLNKKGIAATLALPDPQAGQLSQTATGNYALSPSSPSHFQQLLAACAAPGAIVYLWGLDQSGEHFDEQQHACAGALHLLQALAQYPGKDTGTGKPRLHLVTRGAQKVLSGEQLPAPQQALLWGLGSVAAAEHSEWASICLDLEPNTAVEQAAAELLAATALPHEETRIAWRNNSAYAARLTLSETDSEPDAPFAAKPDVSYLITGAQGALGRELAAWLVQRGARHLALIGRSAPEEAWLEDLASQGASPCFYQADVADISALAAVIEQAEHRQAPLAGVFHLAGILDDGLLAGQSWPRWQQVLTPKVTGAWNLHRLTRDKDLAVFVNFSSLASLLGPAGQGSYAAANAFLDALANQRYAAGLAGLSINWGPWAEAGMAARLDTEQQARMDLLGIARITTRHALDKLGKLLPAAQGQTGVLAVDWQGYSQTNKTPLLNHLAGEKTDASIYQQLQQAAGHERRERLTQLLVSVVTQVLHLSPDEVAVRDRLFDLGIDSLTALDMKNRLQSLLECSLSSTLLFDHPTIEALTDYFLDKLFPISAVQQPVVQNSPLQRNEGVEEMSEAEAEALLLAELEQMEKQPE